MGTSKYVDKTILEETGLVVLSMRPEFVEAGQEAKRFVIASNNKDREIFIEQAIETLEREAIATRMSKGAVLTSFNARPAAKDTEISANAQVQDTTPAAYARGFDW